MNGGFTHTALPGRVVFGAGTLERLPEEADRLAISSVIVLSTPNQRVLAEEAARHLGSRASGIFSEAAMHTPVDVTESAVGEALRLDADGIVAIGGSSVTGLAKAIALRTDLKQIVIPTTYAGSEMTPILGQTDKCRKTTLRDHRVLPETVIYDVTLTLGLPTRLSAASGLNAIAHAVEALYARDRNPLVGLLAEEGIALLARSLPLIVRNPADVSARSDALRGAWFCGICLGSVGMALHHRLCHTLGGMLDLPHAETHAVILPHAMRYNAEAAGDAACRIACAVGAQDAAIGLRKLAEEVGAPLSLAELGMNERDIDPAVTDVMSNPYWNPAPLDEARLRRLLQRALAGSEP